MLPNRAALGRELRARLPHPQDAQVDLSAARELRQVVPGHPQRVLPPPPGVDRLRVGLHLVRERREAVAAVRRDRVDPVHRGAGEDIRREVVLGGGAAPGCGGRRGPEHDREGACLSPADGLDAGEGAVGPGAAEAARGGSERKQHGEHDDHGRPPPARPAPSHLTSSSLHPRWAQPNGDSFASPVRSGSGHGDGDATEGGAALGDAGEERALPAEEHRRALRSLADPLCALHHRLPVAPDDRDLVLAAARDRGRQVQLTVERRRRAGSTRPSSCSSRTSGGTSSSSGRSTAGARRAPRRRGPPRRGRSSGR